MLKPTGILHRAKTLNESLLGDVSNGSVTIQIQPSEARAFTREGNAVKQKRGKAFDNGAFEHQKKPYARSLASGVWLAAFIHTETNIAA